MEEQNLEEEKVGKQEEAEDKLEDQMLQNTNDILVNSKEF